MSGKCILLVEDDLEVRDALTLLLETKGYSVIVARTGEGALELLDQKRPDLVLLDVILPRLTGWDVLRQIREVYPQLGVIMLTGRSDSVDRVVGLELGADDYVAKPFEPPELLARIGAVLRRSKRSADGEAEAEGHVGHWPEDRPRKRGHQSR
jgi:DNA-binding response OmpR family regulator